MIPHMEVLTENNLFPNGTRGSMTRRSAPMFLTPARSCLIAGLLASLLLAGCGRAVTTAVSPESTAAPEGSVMVPATDSATPTQPEKKEESTASANTPIPTTVAPSPQGVQRTVVAPTRESLSAYPGILRSMTLSREDVLSLLGPEHEIFSNIPLGYTVYTWNATGIALEFDDLSGRLRLIRVADRTLFLDGADYRNEDLNRDGIAEGICAFETNPPVGSEPNTSVVDARSRRQAMVTVIDEATGAAVAETMVSPFDGYARLSFLPAYAAAQETLVVLDTQSEWECDVLSFTGGQLVSMLPADVLQIEEQSKVSIDVTQSESVLLEVSSVGLSFQCALPDRLAEALQSGEPFSHRFVVNRKPVITDEGLSLRIRHSLQVLLGNAETLDGLLVGRFIDVGQVSQEYRYVGSGEWKLLATGGGPKYSDPSQGANLTMDEMVAGQTYLFSSLYDIEETYGLDPAGYTDFDLIAGLHFIHKGLRIEVVNARVARMEAGAACPLETVRGLKTGDTRGTALSLLGLPDAGYFEDRMWTYWFYRGFDGPDERVLSLDRFTVEFSGDLVERIRMEGYVPID